MCLWADLQLPVAPDHIPVSSWPRGRSSKELHLITLPVSTRAGAHPAKAEGHGIALGLGGSSAGITNAPLLVQL